MKDPKNPTGFYRDVAPWMIDDVDPASGFAHIDPKTGKLTVEHIENCSGCALCEGDQ